MSTERVTVSLPAEVKEAAQRVATAMGVPFSSAPTPHEVDALVALLALPGDLVVTSDVDDLSNLLGHRGVRATVRSI